MNGMIQQLKKPRAGQKLVATTLVVQKDAVSVPGWVVDLASFRHWAYSEDFPERGRICYLDGDIWVDLSMEEIVHNLVKLEISAVLAFLARKKQLGKFFADGFRLSHGKAGLSCEPDGLYVSWLTLKTKRARFVEGAQDNLIEIEGSPDMILEVVSPSSVTKDTVTLLDLYWRTGIKEYWLVEDRGDGPVLDILSHGPKGYASVRRSRGWVKSAVFGKSFRLISKTDRLGYPAFQLAVR